MDFAFKFEGQSVEMKPAITKWGFEDLQDQPHLHRWRAWWAQGDVSGIEMHAYPVVRNTHCGAWIDTIGYREATKQPWEDGAPALDWVKSKHKCFHRLVMNDSAKSWAKPTQEEAIHSLAVRLTRWTGRLSGDFSRARSAVTTLQSLRPDLHRYAESALKNLSIE